MRGGVRGLLGLTEVREGGWRSPGSHRGGGAEVSLPQCSSLRVDSRSTTQDWAGCALHKSACLARESMGTGSHLEGCPFLIHTGCLGDWDGLALPQGHVPWAPQALGSQNQSPALTPTSARWGAPGTLCQGPQKLKQTRIEAPLRLQAVRPHPQEARELHGLCPSAWASEAPRASSYPSEELRGPAAPAWSFSA